MAWGGIKTRIREGEAGSTPSQVSDLTAELSDVVALDLFYTQPTNSAYERFRFREVGETTWSTPLRLTGSVTSSISLRSEIDYECQVQGTGTGGKRGAWSNTATFSTPDVDEDVLGEQFDVVVRQNYAGGGGGSELYSHSLAAVAASVNEGSAVQWDYTLAKNGGSNETYTVRVRTVQPSLPTGSYAQTIVEACQAVSETGVTFVGNGTPTDLTFSINAATFDGTFRISRTTTDNELNQGAVTSISNASPGVVTMAAAHGYAASQPVLFTTSGGLPTGLSAATTYYVKSPTSTTFQLSATAGGAAINTSSAGSGTHRCHLMSGLLIEAVSAGTNSTPTGQLIKITDTFTTEPDPGDLSYLTLSSDWLHSPNINTGVPVAVAGGTTVGTHRVGQVQGFDSDDVETTLASCTLTNTVGGRFKITSTAGVAPFYLDVDSGLPITFLVLGGVNREPIMHYNPSINATDAGAVPASLTPNVRPKYPKVEPTGDVSATVLTQDTMAELYTTLAATGDSKTIQISSAWVNVAPQTATSMPKLRRSNATYIGHPRWAMKHRRGIVFQQGSNIIVKDWAFRVDGSYALITGTPALEEIDNLMLAYAGTGMLRNIWFQNCSFSTSNDELMRIKGNLGFYTQGARFTNCLFARGLYNSGHPNGAPHNLGPAISPGNSNSVFDFCAMLDLATRMPRANRTTGFTVRNCLIANWFASATYGGVNLNQGDVGAGLEVLTARIEANLFDAPADAGVPGRSVAINCDGLTNVNTAYCYIPSTGNYRNQFINMQAGTFTTDPLTWGDGITGYGGTVQGVIRDAAPYELADDYGIMPTSTEAEIIALKDRILDYVGVRQRVGDVHTGDLIPGDEALCAFDYDVVNRYRTTGLGDNTYTPTEVNADYESNWNNTGGTGTKGHGMADAIADVVGAPGQFAFNDADNSGLIAALEDI